MPNFTFILPHWIYWSGLLLLPLLAMHSVHRQQYKTMPNSSVSVSIACFLLITAGFIGMHCAYLRQLSGLLYLSPFIMLLYSKLRVPGHSYRPVERQDHNHKIGVFGSTGIKTRAKGKL